MLDWWDEIDVYGRIREARAGLPPVRAPRRPALRQRQHPPRPGAEQDPQGLRRQVPLDDGPRRASTCPAGTATGCRSSTASTRNSARARAEMDAARDPRSLPRPTPRSSSRSSATSSGDWACCGTGRSTRRGRAPTTRRAARRSTARSTTPTRPRSSASSAVSSPRARSTTASSRCTGATRARPRWPRPRSSTRTAATRRSTSKFPVRGARSARRRRWPGARSRC